MTTNNINPSIGKSMFYDHYGPAEEVQFLLPSENPHVKGYLISGETRVRDYLNIVNQLAEIEDSNQDFSYDETALQKDLAAYVKACDEADKARWVSYAIHNFEGNLNAIENWYPEHKEVYGEYAQELISAKEKGLSLDKVKAPGQRRSKLQQIFGKQLSDLGVKIEIDSLNTEELTVVKELFKKGFPSRKSLADAYKKYQDKANEIMKPFGYQKRNEMFTALMKRYGKSLQDDLREAVSSRSDDKIHFMNEKELEAFNKMSLKEVSEKYGIEKMYTCKGAVMIAKKIDTEKNNPKKLAETLTQALAIVQQQRKCFHVPFATREFMFETIKNAYQNMPQKKAEYGKFSAVDNAFRKIFSTLKPQPDELNQVAEFDKILKRVYTTNKKTLELLQKRSERLQNFTAQIDSVLNQKVDISKVKSDLKLKLLKAQSENNDNGGVIAADRHAEAVQKAAESGIHFKGGKAEIDFEAYREETGNELNTKRTERQEKFSKKQTARQNKAFHR